MKHKVKASILAVMLAALCVAPSCTPPSWFAQVESIAKIIVPIAGSIIDIVDPAVAPLVTIAENAFNALAKAIDDYIKTPTSTTLQAVQAAFNDVNSNVAQLTAAAQIKNPQTDATVTGIISLLNQAVNEIAALVPPPATGKAKALVPVPVKHWNADDFKKAYDDLVKGDSRFSKL